MEGMLGRPLKPTEDVHHLDGDKTNNAPENLELMDHGEHSRQTNFRRKYRKGYKLNLTPEQRKKWSLDAIATRIRANARALLSRIEGE
jgi:hypothetical protein